MKRFAIKMLRMLLEISLLTLVGLSLLLIFFQQRLIYFPRPYLEDELRSTSGNVRKLSYATAQGRQTAFYLPPTGRPPATPGRLWVVFPGNAMLALDWLGFLGTAPMRETDGFLLIDYPGYGGSAGAPSPKAIEESSQAALATWRTSIGESATPPKVGILGLSLGAAAGLQLATHEDAVDRVVLIAPFATLLEEARRSVGRPLCYLLRHRFDNVSRLRELAARPSPPRVCIFHGTEDITIPPDRSRALKAAFPQMISLSEIDGADHNNTLDIARREIFEAMRD